MMLKPKITPESIKDTYRKKQGSPYENIALKIILKALSPSETFTLGMIRKNKTANTLQAKLMILGTKGLKVFLFFK